jgi:membrane carboxypeptidase/penicillin-binding protein PbpC
LIFDIFYKIKIAKMGNCMKSSKEMDIDNSKLVVSLYNESKPEFWFLNGRWIGLMNSDSGRIPEGFKSSLDLFLIIEYYNDLFKKNFIFN